MCRLMQVAFLQFFYSSFVSFYRQNSFTLQRCNTYRVIIQEYTNLMQQVRVTVWKKLEVVLKPYFLGRDEIDKQTVESILMTIFKERKTELEYVLKNFGRIDTDGNGTVSFFEFGNFLLTTHCGQLVLQRDHLLGKMSQGKQRIMTLEEYSRLISAAFGFLEMDCPEDVKSQFSRRANAEGYITYGDYFESFKFYVNKDPKPFSCRSQGSQTRKEIQQTKEQQEQKEQKQLQPATEVNERNQAKPCELLAGKQLSMNELYAFMFKLIDTEKHGSITFDQFAAFIKTKIGKDLKNDPKWVKPRANSSKAGLKIASTGLLSNLGILKQIHSGLEATYNFK